MGAVGATTGQRAMVIKVRQEEVKRCVLAAVCACSDAHG